MKHLITRHVIGFLLPALAATPVAALDFSISGFMTIAAGQIVDKDEDNPPYLDYDCPCYITDYNQGAVYEGSSPSLLPESRIGLQSTVFFTPELSFTGQVVARAVDHDASLEWAYLSWRLSNDWTLQLGRKRIPIYFYSDYQDVGNVYVMVRPQQALYGWEVSNYNGGSLAYQNSWGDWSISGSFYGGEEEVKNSEYQQLYDTIAQDAKWENIIGTEWTFNRDWFTSRITYMQSDNRVTGRPDIQGYEKVATEQEIIGLALNADFGEWFVLSEFNQNRRQNRDWGMDVKAPATSLGIGHRIDSFTLFANYAKYRDKTNDIAVYEPEVWSDTSLTLRYDIDPGSDVKIQFDRFKDSTYYDFVGETMVVTVAYDLVFF